MRSTQTGLRYKAIESGDIQVMDAYASDGRLKEFDLVILEGDKKVFPPCNGAYVVRMDAVEAHPEAARRDHAGAELSRRGAGGARRAGSTRLPEER